MAEKVLINSFPKAGTNLVAKALDLMGYRESFHLGSNLIFRKAKLKRLFYSNLLVSREKYHLGIDTQVPYSQRFVNYLLSDLKEGEYCTTHFLDNKLMTDYLHELKVKMIIVSRNPLAILNSSVKYINSNRNHYFYSYINMLNESEKYLQLYKGFSYRGRIFKGLREKIESFPFFNNNPALLYVTFESLIGSVGGGSDTQKEATIKKILEYLNNEGSSESFISKNLFGEGRSTFRKGIVDSWKEEMPENIQEIIIRDLESLKV